MTHEKAVPMPIAQTPSAQRELLSLDISDISLNDTSPWWKSPFLRWSKPPLLYIFMCTAWPYEMKIGETGGKTAERIVRQRREFSHHDRLLLIHIRDLNCELRLRRAAEGLLQLRVQSEMRECYLQAEQISQYSTSQINNQELRYVVDTAFDYIQSCFPPLQQQGPHPYKWLMAHATDTFWDPAGRYLGRGIQQGLRFTLLPGCRIAPLKRYSVSAEKKVKDLHEAGYLTRTTHSAQGVPTFKVHRPITLSCRETARWLISGGNKRGYCVRSDEPARSS